MSRRISEYVLWQAYSESDRDSHNNPKPTWGTGRRTGVFAFDPGSSSEPREPGHDRVIVEPTVYLPPGVILGARDRVTARGLLYEVEGVTRDWVHPDGRVLGGVASLRRVEG